MTADQRQDEHGSEQSATANEGAESIVQAGTIAGDVHVQEMSGWGTVPRQLPPASTDFVGREHELSALTGALGEAAEHGNTKVIFVLTGPAGIGKTWLALHWAHQNLDRFPDGQLFVDLRGFSPASAPAEPADVVRTFLNAIGVGTDQMPASLDAQAALYRQLVASKRMLIVLDNAASSSQVTPLLPNSPTCTVIVTSRQRLSVLGVRFGARRVDLDVLPAADAWALLTRYLGAERVAAEPAAAAELLASCAGLPLALAIVAACAAREPGVPLAMLADELHDSATLLDLSDDDDPAISLRVALSVSVRAVSPLAARMFKALGAATGPDIDLSGAASLAAMPAQQTRAALRELKDASLVQEDMPRRYRMHSLIRLYAGAVAEQWLADQAIPSALDTETIPVVVYLDNATPAPQVEQALDEVLTEFGLQPVHREPPIVRSWFRRMTVKFDRSGGPEVTRRLLRELDRAVELRAVDQIQAQVDAAQGDVVAKLLTALADTSNALIQIGSVLLIKVEGVPVVRNLTQTELAYLQRNPQLSQDPAACLRVLQHMVDHAHQDGHAEGQSDQPALAARAGAAGDESARQSDGSTGPTR
ncbi:ATP-binding protein [Amycolatopsis sp. H6(2020)]|nr:ATP-binding protein [Amycolatopsis sp. H6(2020)]